MIDIASIAGKTSLKACGIAVLAVALGAASHGGAAHAADDREVEFSILEQQADEALTAFAQQAGLSVLFPYDSVSRVRANRLVGSYRIGEGLEVLLENTGLEASLDSGVRLTIRVQEDTEPKPTAAQLKGLLASVLGSVARVLGGRPSESGRREGEVDVGRLEEVTVTGSRILQTDFHSAQPATVIGAGMIARLGIVNTGDAMAQLPSSIGSWTPTAKPGGNESFPLNVFNGLNLANLRGLNPTYGSRTLTLIDSRRHVPTNQGDGVDLNMIPTILIDRIEVVTGSASASYGSGAIGGVVNILMDRDLDGLKAQLDFGATLEGDGNDGHVGIAWGMPIGSRGRLVAAVETQDMEPIENCIEVRDWCARGASVRENRDFATTEEPNFVYREGVRFDMSTRGLFTALGLEFDESGTALVPYTTTDALGIGGSGQHIYLDTTLRTNVDRRIAYVSYEQQLGRDLALYVEASAGTVTSWTPQDSIDLFGAKLAPDNFYLNRLDENPCAASPDDCRLSKDFSAQVDAVNDTQTDLRRMTLGFTGRFGDSSWTWDAYYQGGESDALQAVYNSRHAQRMLFALDAVDDGTGNAVCRVTRDGIDPGFQGDPLLAAGCVPVNVFGTKDITPEALEYAWGRILENTYVEQDMIELVTSGEMASVFGAGPMHGAAGFSWRDESLDNIADTTQPDSIRNDYNSLFGETFGGDVEVYEYFAELGVPLTQSFELQLAARRSHYENSAGVGTPVVGRRFKYDIDTWKINGNWQAHERITFRASRSRDIRAPNFRELYYSKVFSLGSNFGYCDNPWSGNRFLGFYTFTGDPCRAELRGGLDLKPERSDTSTLGFVLTSPETAARLAVDFFEIEIEDAITPANWFYTTDRCYDARDPEFCSLIEGPLLDPGDPLGGFARIDVVSSKALNQRYYRTRGVDLSFDWVRELGPGTLSTRVMASHMIEQLVQPSATSPLLEDIAGVTGTLGEGADWEPAADWAAQWVTTFDDGPLSVTLQARYVSDGKKHATRRGPQDEGFDPNAADSIDDNRVPSYVIWGASGAWAFDWYGTRIELFGGVQNLFDKDPPLIGSGIGGTNPVFFDTVGRRYRLGLRVNF